MMLRVLRHIAVVLCALWCTSAPALAQKVVFSPSISPYDLSEYLQTGYQDTTGKTVFAGNLNDGKKTFVLTVPGQSNGGNHVNTTYTTASAECLNLNPYSGTLYRYSDPALGAGGTGGNWVGRLCDKLIAAGTFARVIIIPISVGGSLVSDWTPSGSLYQRLLGGLMRKRALIASITGSTVISGTLWVQGEGDNFFGTSQANYQSRFMQVFAAAGALGDAGIWWLPKVTLNAGSVSATIQAAQTALVNGTTIRFAGDYDSLTGGTNRYDTTHFTQTGGDAAAAMTQALMSAVY